MRAAVFACLLAACGADAADPLNIISVTVRDAGVPLAGAPVWFQRMDSTLVLETMTGPDGIASAVLDEGYVSVLFTTLPDDVPVHTLYTYAQARSGDMLVLDGSEGAPATHRITLELPPGFERYRVVTACSDGFVDSATATVFLGSCPDTTPLLVGATTTDDTVLGWLYEPAAAIADGALIDLRTRTFDAPANVTLDLAVPPYDNAAVLASVLVDDALLPCFDNVVGLTSHAAQRTMSLPIVDGTHAVHMRLSTPFEPDHWAEVLVWGPSPSDVAIRDAQLFPPISRPTILGRALQWDQLPPVTMIDAHFQVSTATTTRYWQITAPVHGNHVALPALPGTIADYQPIGIASVSGRLIRTTASYDDLRATLWDHRRRRALIHGPEGVTVTRGFER